MKIEQIAKIAGGQDGAIYGSELFRLNHRGECAVYHLSDLQGGQGEQVAPFANFLLDRAEQVVPHSNAVCFGCEFYEAGDKYPLLYTNIYNNYAKGEDKKMGVCLVYRIVREGDVFASTLVQSIEIGFCEDSSLWKAEADQHGVRPYGNFVVDTDRRDYWAFVMRNEEKGSRYFRFRLPSAQEGVWDEALHTKRVVLQSSDVLEYFDCAYQRYMQGAVLHRGKIYATEGFRNDAVNRPAIRVIDLATKKEAYFDITSLGFCDEPELLDFAGDRCLYSDFHGNLYTVEF